MTIVLEPSEELKPTYYTAQILPIWEQRRLLEILAVSYAAKISLHFAIEAQYPEGWPHPQRPDQELPPTPEFENLLTQIDPLQNWERLRLMAHVVESLKDKEKSIAEGSGK